MKNFVISNFHSEFLLDFFHKKLAFCIRHSVCFHWPRKERYQEAVAAQMELQRQAHMEDSPRFWGEFIIISSSFLVDFLESHKPTFGQKRKTIVLVVIWVEN